MKVVIQRASDAMVVVDEKLVNKITKGFVVLVGFTMDDDIEKIAYLARKIVNLRVFDDENAKMNRSISEIKGEILCISQFTLYADTKKGNRPSYTKALDAGHANVLYELFIKELNKYVLTKGGIFQANMQVKFTNDGPVTIIMER